MKRILFYQASCRLVVSSIVLKQFIVSLCRILVQAIRMSVY